MILLFSRLQSKQDNTLANNYDKNAHAGQVGKGKDRERERRRKEREWDAVKGKSRTIFAHLTPPVILPSIALG